MDGKGQVLVHANICPPDSLSVGVAGTIRFDTLFACQAPLFLLVVQRYRSHKLPLPVSAGEFPPAHMMAACNYARSDALCYPGLYDKVTNLSFNAHQVTSLDSELFGMARMNPQRIGVCDLVKPFRVGASRV